MRFKANEPSRVDPRTFNVDIAPILGPESGGKMLNRHEVEEIDKLQDARDKHEAIGYNPKQEGEGQGC